VLPPSIAPILLGALFALPTAALTPHCLPAAAVLAASGVLVALHARLRCRAGLCALPALLAALPAPRAALPPMRPGPVLVAGCVSDVVRAPLVDTTYVVLGDGAHTLRLQFAGDLEVLPGDRLRTFARLSARGRAGPAGSLHGVLATVHVTPGPYSLQRLAAATRRVLERELLRLLPGEHGAMLATLVLGRETRTSGELTAAHQATGLSHLLAVSGAHAAMLAFLLGFTGRGRGRRLAAGRLRTITVMLILFAYAAITGNEPPVLRAVVAFALAAIACHLGRPFGLATGLLAPAFATCLLQPDALLGPSFLLSYAAVCGLALATHHREGWAWRWLWGPIWASWWATLLTAPLTLFFFGQLAPWTVLLTPILAPLVAFLLCVGLVTAMLGVLVPCSGTRSQCRCRQPPTSTRPSCARPTRCPARRCTRGRAGHVDAVSLRAGRRLRDRMVAESRRRHRCRGAAARALVPALAGSARSALPAVCDRPRPDESRGHRVGPPDRHRLRQHAAPVPGRRAARPSAARTPSRPARRDARGPGSPQRRAHAAALRADRRRDPAEQHGWFGARIAARGPRHARCTCWQPASASNRPPHLHLAAPSLPEGASDNDQSLWVSVSVDGTRVLLTGDAEELGVAGRDRRRAGRTE
jgi:competence protein ComEC